MIVVDASAIVEILLNTSAAPRLATRLFAAGETLHAPHVIDLEILHALRRYAIAGTLTAKRGYEAIQDLSGLPLERYPHHALAERIWELRNHVTAYDAAYVALAEALDAPLVTRDAALGRARHRALVEVL